MAGQRQPVDLLIAKGKKNLTKKEIAARQNSEIKAKSDAVSPPSYLNKKQSGAFSVIAEQLIAIGIMSNLDVDALARYVQSREKYIKYDKMVNKVLREMGTLETAIIYLGAAEKFENLRDKAIKQCRSAASDLGLTIASRCKLVVPEMPAPKDPHASIFGDKGIKA